MVIVYLEFKLHDYDADFEFKTHLQPSTWTYVGVPHWSVCRHEEFWSLHVQNSPCQKLRFHKSFVHSIQSNIRNDVMSSKHTSNRVHGLTLLLQVGQFVVMRNSEAYMRKVILVNIGYFTKVLIIPSKVILEMMLWVQNTSPTEYMNLRWCARLVSLS